MSSAEAQLLRHWGVPPTAGPGWAETFVSMQFGAYPLVDTTGRPLGEANAVAPLRAGVPFDQRACPYADSRRGAPMNVTALRAVHEDWPHVLGMTAALRAAYVARHPADRLSLAHLWSFAAIVQAMPIFLVRSRAVGIRGVPRPVASTFKVVQGVAMLAWAGLDADDPDPDGVGPLLAGVEARRLLHSRTGRVCSGPAGMIEELLSLCLHGRESAPLPGADGLLDWGQAFAAIAIERAPPTARRRAHRDALVGSGPAERGDWLAWAQARACAAAGREGPTVPFDPAWVLPAN